MYDLVWSCLVTMLMYFLVRLQMVLFGRVWSCMALRSYAQFLCLLIDRVFKQNMRYFLCFIPLYFQQGLAKVLHYRAHFINKLLGGLVGFYCLRLG